MTKLYRVLGKRGRITIPFEIRQRVGFTYNDVLSFNLSRFSVSVNEQETGTELTVTMIHPCEGLSDVGIRRATTALADSISQHLENELVINKLKA